MNRPNERFWFRSFLRQFNGTLLTIALFLLISWALAPGFGYMGQDSSGVVSLIIKHFPLLTFTQGTIILGVLVIIAAFLQLALSPLHWLIRAAVVLLIVCAALLRQACFYPAMVENWSIVAGHPWVREQVQSLALLPLNSSWRTMIGWLPFGIFVLFWICSILIALRELLAIQDRLATIRRDVAFEEHEALTSRLMKSAFHLLLVIGLGLVIALRTHSNLNVSVRQYPDADFRPNLFIFAIDSLRFDRLSKPQFQKVMPFLHEKIASADLFMPMVIGVPRTFPSWVELMSCSYAINTGVRTMFPTRQARLGRKETLMQAASDAGYYTAIVSDFAGDLFPRYPFGAKVIETPDFNLKELLQNGVLQRLPALQSLLVLPEMHRMLPALLENADFADPRLLTRTVAKALGNSTVNNKPVFMTTFFSTSHFPYAAPSPWFASFQDRSKSTPLPFLKNPNQVVTSQNTVGVIPANHRQTAELYDGSLQAIDDALARLWTQLEEEGWLRNAIVVVTADHGENLFEGTLGSGHGDGLAGEYSGVVPLAIWTNGRANESASPAFQGRLARSIDLAPTLARRLRLPFDLDRCEGSPLLDITDKQPRFRVNAAYSESGLWFIDGKQSPEGQERIWYPGILELMRIDAGLHHEVVLDSKYATTVVDAKERAWITDRFRLVTRAHPDGVTVSLYDRERDLSSTHNLLDSSRADVLEMARPIAQEMLRQMNEYLTTKGVDVVENGKGRFFYSESVPR